MEARLAFSGVLLVALAAAGTGCNESVESFDPPRLTETDGLQPCVLRLVNEALTELERDPRDANRWRRLGLTYLVNFIDLAEPCLAQAARLDPRDARTWYHLGRARAELGEVESALVAVDTALELAPALAHLHWSRGFWLLEAGRLEEAQAAFVTAGELAPGALPVSVGAARVALQSGAAATAANLFEEVLRNEPAVGRDYVQSQLATAYRRLGRTADAVALGQMEAVKRPAWDDPWIEEANEHRVLKAWVLHDARLAVGRGRAAWAIERLEALAACEPDDPAVRFELGRALHAAGRTEQAIGALEQAVALGGDSFELHLNMIGACLQTGRAADALRHGRRAVQLQPDDALVQLSYARAAFLARELAESVAALRRSAELAPLDPRARVMLGEALCGLSRWDEALAAIEPVTRSNPELAGAWLCLARAHAELERGDEAETALARARSLDPRASGLDLVARRVADVRGR